MSIEGWVVMGVVMHMASFLMFFVASVYSFRQGGAFLRGKAELEKLYDEGRKNIEGFSREANKEALRWMMRNAGGGAGSND